MKIFILSYSTKQALLDLNQVSFYVYFSNNKNYINSNVLTKQNLFKLIASQGRQPIDNPLFHTWK
jgi:hypothetical protein